MHACMNSQLEYIIINTLNRPKYGYVYIYEWDCVCGLVTLFFFRFDSSQPSV
jgi:hypothetical protein